MGKLKKLGKVAQGAESSLGIVAQAVYRKPVHWLIGIFVVTLISGYFAKSLTLDSDLTQLLPKTFKSIQDIDKLTERFGGVGWVVVVARDAEPEMLRKFADDMAPKLDKLKSVDYVDYQRPSKFFEDRALYFLDVEDLQYVREKLAARMDWEKQQRNPLYLDLEESDPPALDFERLQKKYADPEDGTTDNAWLASQLGEPYYINEEERMVALLAKPSSQSIDLAFSQEMVGEIEELLKTIDTKEYGPDMNLALTGRYMRRVELQRFIQKDLNLTSVVAVVLMLFYLAFHFRRMMAIVFVLGPLAIGLIWTFGYTSLVFGTLNILTGFVGAIMLGLGIDHGIHLLGRFEAECSEGHERDVAIRNTFGETGRAVMVAALTTMVGFACLGISEFRAFSEFGLVAAAGMVLTVVSYTVSMPALISIASRVGWSPRTIHVMRDSYLPGFVMRNAPKIAITALVVFVFSLYTSSLARFDFNFSSLESNDLPSFVLDHQVNEILGFTYIPVAILSDNMEEERVISRALRDRKKERGAESTIDVVASSADLIPLNQKEKQPVIASIGDVIDGVKARWFDDPDVRSKFLTLKRNVKSAPFTRDDLPEQLKRLFRGAGGQGEEGFVLVFPAIRLSDGNRILEFASDVRGVELPGGKVVSAAGEDLILADILMMLERESPVVLTLTVVAIFITLTLLLGGVRDAILCLIPAVFTLFVMLGLLPFVDLNLNYLNIVMIPILFGIGVDGGAHVVTRIRSGMPMQDLIPETGRAIAGAIFTTLLGFGALLLAHHHGLNSLGMLAALGLCVNLFGSLVVLPSFIVWLEKRGGEK